MGNILVTVSGFVCQTNELVFFEEFFVKIESNSTNQDVPNF